MNDIVRKNLSPLMSQIVIHNDVVYLSGQVHPEFAAGLAPIKTQVAGILSRIDELLAAAGSSRSRLLSAQILLVNVTDFSEMNEVWQRWIDPKAPPARTTCGAVLAHPNISVEITVVAAL